MARIFTEGFELGDALFFNTGAATSIVTTAGKVRSGTYAARLMNSSTAGKTITAAAEYYFRAGLNSSLHTNALQWFKGATKLGEIRYNVSTQCWDAYTSTATLVASGAIAVAPNTYFLLEVHVSIADSGGIIATKIDGIADISFSGDTKPGADTTIDAVKYGAAFSGDLYVDDLACNNTSGGDDNSWCGDGHIIYIAPDADGDASDLTGSDGNKVNNWDNVNAIPYNAAIYNQSATLNERDLYNIADYDGTGKLITSVWVEGRAIDTVAAGGTCYLGIKASGGSERYCSAISLLTSYTRIVGDRLVTNPEDSGAWEETDIDALQVGFKVGA